jgi:nitrate/TMAO reductase-like tetraheme cytochrome c subunit
MKLPRTYYNPTSLAGTILAAVSALIIVFFMITMTFFEGDATGAYVGIFSYIILPVFLIIGLILIPVGMARRSKRIKREGEDSVVSKIVLDLSNQSHWNAVGLFILVSILFLLLTGIGSYKAFHYTESNKFCGTLCHSVMEPEYTAYQESAHSRVTCVECHVGEGAKWYVRSKLSGLYQVYSVTFNKYPTPIETPIHNLRPARETCEECHWPEKFYSQNLVTEKNYLADSANTEWDIQLKMKIGSEHSALGLMEGIHWHINSDVKIEYIASSDKREYIPWVRFVNRATGDTTLYQDINEPLDQEAIDTLEMREMDCLDCHNRPSHQFQPPQKFTDDLIAAGVIPVELPEVKSLAMQVFNYNTFTDRDSGAVLISESVRDFYNTGYPEIADAHPELIDRAIEGFLTGYDKNYFPKMKANWDAYPNHIGHSEFNGCFRCHNGNHESEDGSVISRDCNLCHTIVGQGTPDNFETSSVDVPLDFRHPVDIDEAWKEMACSDCHRYLY